MASHDRIQTGELHNVLERVLSQHFGRKTRVSSVRRRRSRYSSSFPIENLELRAAGAASLRLVFKDSSPASLLEDARAVRPHFLYHPLREIETYRGILEPERFGTPIFYGAVSRPKLDRYWLFLEHVPGPLLWQAGRLETWQQASRWLARFHCHFAQVAGKGAKNRRVPLLRYDRRLLTLWWARAEEFVTATELRGANDRRLMRSFVRLTDRRTQVVNRLLSFADTFIHGEFYPSNVILRRQGKGLRICPIDWEVAGVGPGLLDLAALTSGSWTIEQKRAMIAAYREALEPARGWPPSLAELMEATRYCQLQLAIQWLGWAIDWSPPKMHARNWLREAVALSTALGIPQE